MKPISRTKITIGYGITFTIGWLLLATYSYLQSARPHYGQILVGDPFVVPWICIAAVLEPKAGSTFSAFQAAYLVVSLSSVVLPVGLVLWSILRRSRLLAAGGHVMIALYWSWMFWQHMWSDVF
jgi:hypothetical protein